MGVPKFFRYISERYPCISEFVKKYQIPEFDNLYLDMNGIIHNCSHPDDSDPHFRITEQQIIANIFHYIEFLFSMIRPQKVFFMAVDGVAPRAKMNQQRGRRFRTAKEASELEDEAKKKGEILPETSRFDSNCITPGTKFMAKLHEQLKYFVTKKVSTDKSWKNCKIILSGHETPGEGEHKIMDYIRYIRSLPGYDPNTRHCLYGLDADLIMLGLCTHDPHFSLLREEVKFGKKSTKKITAPEEIKFYLLHLSLMREYLELEFASLKENLKNFEFDIEKIIDDWVLMGFLVGNDFIPNLPNLHINNGALSVLYNVYSKVLPTLDGYINEGGNLNLKRFEKFMEKLSNIDMENFEEVRDDLLYFEAKTGRKSEFHTAVSCKTRNAELDILIHETENMFSESSEEEIEKDDELAFKNFKDEYYRNKLEYRKVTKEILQDQAEGYVRAIQWNLNYYYNGCCSWSWYYPHHYAPYISDIKNFSDLKIDFDLGTPFKPFEQLLAVLPSASRNLLPECYQDLMINDDSLIKEYYPCNFQTDLNGKKAPWEAVVLVPFIDENKLLNAMRPCNEKLTEEEIKRNTHGPMLSYTYTDNELGIYKAPDYFPSVINHADCKPLFIEDIRVPKEKLIKGAYPGVKLDVFYPGFPTMKHLSYKGIFKKHSVKVFERPSRNESCILHIIPTNTIKDNNTLPEYLIDKIVYIGWPHLTEAKVVSVSNKHLKCMITNNQEIITKENDSCLFHSAVDGINEYNKERLGIDYGTINTIVHVQVIIGRKYIITANGRVNLAKQYSHVLSNYPLQGVVTDIATFDDYKTVFTDFKDIFPKGSKCFLLTSHHYGSMGTVIDTTNFDIFHMIKVSIEICNEPNFSKLKKLYNNSNNNYISLFNSATQLAISNYVFSRITGTLYIINTEVNENISGKSLNIGLNLKFNKKNLEAPGYTKKIGNTWFYSRKAIDLVKAYYEKFPEIFRFLTQYTNVDEVNLLEIYGSNDEANEKLKEIQIWLKTLPTYNIEKRDSNCIILDINIIEKLETIIDNHVGQVSDEFTLEVRPQCLYKPEILRGNIAPDLNAKTEILDRIVNVRDEFSVPLGLKGTVIGIHNSSDPLANEEDIYDIIFDEEFNGATKIGKKHRGYKLTKNSFINITYGIREMKKKIGKPGGLLALAKANQNNNNLNKNDVENSAFVKFINNAKPDEISKQLNCMNINLQQHVVPTSKKNESPKKIQKQINTSTPISNNNTVNVSNQVVDTDFLKKILKISDNNQTNTTTTYSNNHSKPNTYFNLSNSFVINRSAPPNVPPNIPPNIPPYIPPNIPPNIPTNIPPNVPPSSNYQQQCSSTSSMYSKVNAVTRLLNYYQTNGLGCPMYSYFENRSGSIYAQITMPNNKFLTGREAKTREQASENVALDALDILLHDKQKKEPPGFPIPPQRWVQNSHINPLTQCQQQNFNMNMPRQPIIPFKNQSNNLQKNHFELKQRSISEQGTSGKNFVPLQVIMKHSTNKNNPKISKKIESVNSPSGNSTDNVKHLDSITNNQKVNLKEKDKPVRPIKTRIAANFIKK